jgi:hypothetical protein
VKRKNEGAAVAAYLAVVALIAAVVYGCLLAFG